MADKVRQQIKHYFVMKNYKRGRFLQELALQQNDGFVELSRNNRMAADSKFNGQLTREKSWLNLNSESMEVGDYDDVLTYWPRLLF